MKMKMINFERRTGIPLYEQVYQSLETNILSGYLKKGDQLPSIRQAVDLFKVSKTSVEHAYEQLQLNGMIISIAQKGYFVDVNEKHVSLRKEITKQSIVREEPIYRYDFRSQTMDKDAFDLSLWKKYLKEVLEMHPEIATYGDAQGELPLRKALADYAYSLRGVLCRPEQILVGASFQSLFYILCGLLPKNFVFGMEADGFLAAQSVCEDYGREVILLTKDKEGVCMDALYHSDVNVLYINSVSSGTNHQVISAKRRKELLKWVQEKNGWILEDDHNGELRYMSKMSAAMQGFDGGEHIIYAGSFSKLLLPSLRISYMVLPESLRQLFLKRYHTYSPTSSKIEQLALAHYITDGHLLRHLKRLRKRYLQKSEGMYILLKTYFPMAEIVLDESSLQFILRFPKTVDLSKFIEVAKKHSICIAKPHDNELLLSFAAIQMEKMQEALHHLYTLWINLS